MKAVEAKALKYHLWGDGSYRSWPAPTPVGFNYPGIPHPTDPVPSAIMPDEPTGADWDTHEWVGTYDPLTVEPPSHEEIAPNWPSAEQEGCYYIDRFHASATDTDNTYGYPDRPRATIPEAAWGATTKYIEIHGDNTEYEETPDYVLRNPGGALQVRLTGTKEAPVFVVGIDSPRLGNSGGGSDSVDLVVRHVIFDGLIIQNMPGGNRPWPQVAVNAGTEYFCIRHCVLRGSGQASAGGQAFPINGTRGNLTQFVVMYDCTVSDFGDHVENPQERDIHGFRPNWFCRYLWCLDSEITRMQGDCIQCGNSTPAIPDGELNNHDARSHYVWIAGNELHNVFENAIDNKNSFHVISSCNEIHNIYQTGTGGGANNTAYTLSNNSEGPLSGWHWSLFDHVYDSGAGIRDSGDTVGQKNFVIGAIVEGTANYAYRKENNGQQVEWYIVDSVAYDIGGDLINTNQPGSGSVTELHGVIGVNITGGIAQPNVQFGGGTPNLRNIRLQNMGGSIHSAWNQDNVEVSTSDLLEDPANGDFTPKGDARDQNSEHPAYALFESMYGLNIRVDRNGNPRPEVGPWDIGPIEEAG